MLFQVLTRQISIHEEGQGSPRNDSQEKAEDSGGEVSWFLGEEAVSSKASDSEENTESSSVVHPEDRQMDRVGSLGFLYQKTSLDKPDAHAQQLLTPVILEGNENPADAGVSLDLEEFLEAEDTTPQAAPPTRRYSELHHHALSLDDLEQELEDDEEMSEILASDAGSSLVPSLMSGTSGGQFQTDSLDGGSSVVEKASDRMSPLSFASEQSRPVSPLSMSDTESLAPLLSPLPPTPEMFCDLDDLPEDLEKELPEVSLDVESHDSLDTPPIPEDAAAEEDTIELFSPVTVDVPNEGVNVNKVETKENEKSENTEKPTTKMAREEYNKRTEMPTTKTATEENNKKQTKKAQKNTAELKVPTLTEENVASDPEVAKQVAVPTQKDSSAEKAVPGEKLKTLPELPFGMPENTAASDSERTKQQENAVMKTDTKPNADEDAFQDAANIPGAFIKLGTKKRNLKTKPSATASQPPPAKRVRSASPQTVTPSTLGKLKDKMKSNLQKNRAKGAKIDDLNIVPSRQHSHVLYAGRSRKGSSGTAANTATDADQNKDQQTRVNAEACATKSSVVTPSTSNAAPMNFDFLGPLKSTRRISRVNSSEKLPRCSSSSSIKTTDNISNQCVKIETVKCEEKPVNNTGPESELCGYAGLPRLQTSDQFKRRSTRFPKAAPKRSCENAAGQQVEKCTATQEAKKKGTTKRKAASLGGDLEAVEELKTKKVCSFALSTWCYFVFTTSWWNFFDLVVDYDSLISLMVEDS